MVFYRTASRAGLRLGHSPDAVIYENEPQSRLTLAYQLRLFLWMGNSSYLTRLATGEAGALRMLLQGANTSRKALLRPMGRLIQGRNPQVRYSLACFLNGIGTMLGVLGVRMAHH